MRFRCSRELLDRQLQYVSRIVTTRASVPALSNVLIETDKKVLRISATDLELAVTTFLPAEIEQEGAFTVPAKLFQEFVHQNPDEELEFWLESFDFVCKGAKVQARIPGLDPEEYPALPKIAKGTQINLPLIPFIEVIKKVIIACANDQGRPVLTGVYAHFSGEKVTFAATDSFRLVEYQMEIVPVAEEMTILIPARTIQEIIRMSGTFPAEVTEIKFEIHEQQLLITIGTVEVHSRLLSGNFPKYKAIIPKSFVVEADITTSELVQALRLSYIFSQSGTANVYTEITADGQLTLQSYGSQRGSTQHTIYALVQEGFTPLKTAFNAKFLLDAIQATGSTYIKLKFSGVTSPLVVQTEDLNYVQLVMPIRLDAA